PFYACVLACVAAASGCSGSLREPGPAVAKAKAGGDQVSFSCDGDHSAPSQPLRRLSRDELAHTLEDLVDAALPGKLAASVHRELAPVLAALPNDSVRKDAPFSRMDQVVSQQHVDTFVDVAQRTALLLTADETRTQALLACAPKQEARACVERF